MNAEVISLENLSVLQFTGSDAGGFLQSQLTADLRDLEGADARFACVCNPAGRVLGLLLLRKTSDGDYLALCSAALAEAIRAHLSRFVLRAKVDIRLRTDLMAMGLNGYPGESSEALLFDSPGGYYQAAPGNVSIMPESSSRTVDWRAGELVHGIHWLDERTTARFLPQMLGFERIGALSFSKGCYPGQEVIARTRHLGKLKRHPLACQLDQHVHLPSMTEVLLSDGKTEAGAVLVDAVNLEDGHSMAMMVARMPAGFSPRSCFVGQAPYRIEWSGTPDPAIRLP